MHNVLNNFGVCSLVDSISFFLGLRLALQKLKNSTKVRIGFSYQLLRWFV